MIKKQSEIAILGAGVGGLTTAIALWQKGFENITIYERRNVANTIGAGVVLWSNASVILRKLNLLTAIEKVGCKLDKMERWTHDNVFLGAIAIDDINTIIGEASFSICRQDLQNVLLQKIEELQIKIIYNQVAKKISYKENIGTVLLENGFTINAAIIIGAEGRMHSISRQYVNDDNLPIYQNFVNWIGTVKSKEPIFSEKNVLDFWGCGERFGIVPIDAYQCYWAGGKNLLIDSPFKKSNYKEHLHDLFSSWSPKIKEVIALTQNIAIKYIEVFDHDPIPKWYRNNVCLLGDAAHAASPTSGQGACQAIEDAWHFASFLEKSNTIEQAFNGFQNIRQEKTAIITMAGRELSSSLFSNDPVYCMQRNEKAKQTDYTVVGKNMAALWSKNLPI